MLTCLADLPRIRQILQIRRQRTLGNISLYMYLWLIAQNVTMLIVSFLRISLDVIRADSPSQSILAVTPPGPAVAGHFMGQAPFLGSVLFALASDFVVRLALDFTQIALTLRRTDPRPLFPLRPWQISIGQPCTC